MPIAQMVELGHVSPSVVGQDGSARIATSLGDCLVYCKTDSDKSTARSRIRLLHESKINALLAKKAVQLVQNNHSALRVQLKNSQGGGAVLSHARHLTDLHGWSVALCLCVCNVSCVSRAVILYASVVLFTPVLYLHCYC